MYGNEESCKEKIEPRQKEQFFFQEEQHQKEQFFGKEEQLQKEHQRQEVFRQKVIRQEIVGKEIFRPEVLSLRKQERGNGNEGDEGRQAQVGTQWQEGDQSQAGDRHRAFQGQERGKESASQKVLRRGLLELPDSFHVSPSGRQRETK